MNRLRSKVVTAALPVVLSCELILSPKVLVLGVSTWPLRCVFRTSFPSTVHSLAFSWVAVWVRSWYKCTIDCLGEAIPLGIEPHRHKLEINRIGEGDPNFF